MKPAPFAFEAPETLAGVLAVLAEHGADARVLAGGQSLVPLMNFRMVRPAVLVSINRCAELGTIRHHDGHVEIGALVRQADAMADATVRQDCPLLARALAHVGGRANRNRGTVVGSIAHADPLAELPAVALALDAQMVIASASGRRTVAATDFFVDALTTVIEPGEMLQSVAFGCQGADEHCAFLEVGNRRHGFAVAGVALRWRLAGDRCDLARVAVIGAGSTALRVAQAEDSLIGTAVDDTAIAAAAAATCATVEPSSDIHADADYRRNVLGALVERGLREGRGT